LRTVGESEAAVKSLEKAVHLNPALLDAHMALGLTLHSLNRFDEAIQQYRAVQAIAPGCKEARLNLKAASNRHCPIERRYLMNLCLAYDGGEDDLNCLKVLGKHLLSKAPNLAFYGAGTMCRYLFEQIPELASAVSCIIDDNPCLQGTEVAGVLVGAPANLPESVQTVFLCTTQHLPATDMKRNLRKARSDLEVCSLEILEELDPTVIPERAWRTIGTIYPIEIPEIEFLPDQDMILLDLPARMQAQIPNGLGYVHDILKRSGIRFQTVDLDIILYHRYHVRRILDGLDEVVTPSGYVMQLDPWDTGCFTEEWKMPEVLEYFQPEIDKTVSGLIEARPKIIGISLHGTNLSIAKEVVRRVREGHPDVIILVGGYDCVYRYTGPDKFPDFDYMCIREADLTLEPLVKALVKGERPRDLPGVLSKHDSPDRVWEPAPMLEDLDSIPFPKYDWVERLDVYRDYNGYWLAPIIASRGCKWSRCNFCAECFHFRKRDAVLVADEIEWLMKQGAFLFQFSESDVNGDPDNLAAICREVIRRNLKPQFIAQLRIDRRNTLEYFKLLRAAGFSHLRFGVDGWTDHTIRLQNKGYNMRLVEQNLRDCHAAGIHVSVNVVIGVPGETDEDVQETIQNMIRLKPYIDIVENIHPLMLAAGSPYYNDPDKFKIRFRGHQDQIYTKFPHFVPPEYWYSEDPYIGPEERNQRLQRLCTALRQAGMNIGPYAKAMVETLGKGLDNATRKIRLKADDEAATGELADAERPEGAPPRGTPAKLIEEGYRRYNILKYGTRFYALAQSLGPLDLHRQSRATLKEYQDRGKCFIANSLPEIKQLVSRFGREMPVTLIEQDRNEFNILRWNDRYYGLAQSLGAIDLRHIDEHTLDEYRQQGKCIIGDTIAAVRARVDQFRTRRDPMLLLEGYREFNFLEYDGKVYGLAQSLGAIHLPDLGEAVLRKLQANNNCVVASTLAEGKRQVDLLSGDVPTRNPEKPDGEMDVALLFKAATLQALSKLDDSETANRLTELINALTTQELATMAVSAQVRPLESLEDLQRRLEVINRYACTA